MLNLLRTYHTQALARYGLSWQDETVSHLLHCIVQVGNGVQAWVALEDSDRLVGAAAAYTIPSLWDSAQRTARELFLIVAREAWGSTAAVRLEQVMVDWSRKENASPLFLFPSFWCERERVEELMQRGGYQHIGMVCVKEV